MTAALTVEQLDALRDTAISGLLAERGATLRPVTVRGGQR
jgi:hypothetical protein